MASRFPSRSVVGLLVCGIVGCGVKYHPVSGIVYVDGAPMPKVSVTFIPDGPGQPAAGATDSAGRYTLETINTLGVPPGTYTAVVFPPLPNVDAATGKVIPSKGDAPIPAKYGKPGTSGLKMTVPSENYDLRLLTK